MKLSIIVPVYNESKTIDRIIKRIRGVNYPIEHEILLIDDASHDRTLEKGFLIRLKDKSAGHNIRFFRNRINRGKGFAVRVGIKMCRGDIIIIQDADEELDPNDIPALIDPIIKGEADVVYGSRFLGKRWPEGMSFPAWVANRVVTGMANMLFGTKFTDMQTCYKAFPSSIGKSLDLRENRFAFDPEITALFARKRLSIKELPISYRARTFKGGKKIGVFDFFAAIWVLLKKKLAP